MKNSRYLIWGLLCGAGAALIVGAIAASRNREKIGHALDRGREARQLAGDAVDVVRRARALTRPLEPRQAG